VEKNAKGSYMKKLIRTWLMGVAVLGVLLLAAGCSFGKDGEGAKIRDLEYTVIGAAEVPEELQQEIEMNKNSSFKLTYSDGGYLYIANGYGEQETSGFSIQMKELYLTENAIYFKSELFGPENGESVSSTPDYPYIVIKTEMIDLPVVFE
jgi:hypothetical protein